MTGAIFDSNGTIVEYQSVGRDITDMKLFEEELSREKMFSDAVINTIPGAFFVIGRDGRYVRWNKFMEDSLGIPPDQLCNYSALFPVIEEDRAIVAAALENVFETGYGEIIAHVKGKRNVIREFSFIGRRMAHGDHEYVVGTGVDKTEKFQSVRLIEESEKKYRSLFENTGTAMFILDPDMIVSCVNAEFENMSGYTKPEVEGKMQWPELVHPEDAVWMKEYHVKRRAPNAVNIPKSYEFRFITKNKEIRNMSLTLVLLNETNQSIVSLIDITAGSNQGRG